MTLFGTFSRLFLAAITSLRSTTYLLLTRISDAEAVSMSRYLVLNDGLFLGSSSACNLFACVKLVKKMGWQNGERLVTIL